LLVQSHPDIIYVSTTPIIDDTDKSFRMFGCQQRI
jgi:hypothetical protein